jgi:hypothetical protein
MTDTDRTAGDQGCGHRPSLLTCHWAYARALMNW